MSSPPQTYRPSGPGGTISTDQLAPLLDNAATKWGVPWSLLTGVLGMETDFGRNVRTSSTGAMGYMQFEPATAAQYGYPMTNTPTIPQLQQQFNAAAHYLSDLFHKTHSWDAALHSYSGGGYGLPQVQAKARQKLPAGEITPGGINLPDLNPLDSVAAAISSVFNQIVNDAKYAALLVVAVIIGGYLIIHGLTGVTPRDAAKIIPVPA